MMDRLYRLILRLPLHPRLVKLNGWAMKKLHQRRE